MNINSEDSSNRTTLVSQPSAVKLKNITKETELYLFRIPRGLFNIRDLVNKEINIGKKSNKVTINGKKYDFIVRQLDGQENSIQPWLSNSKAVLKPASVLVTAEVRARIHLKKALVGESLDGLEQLAPVVHMPPDLPCRNFFGTSCEDSAGVVAVPSDNSSKKKSKRKSLAVPSDGGGMLATPPTDEPASSRKKRSLSLEELSPHIQQKPFKKKKKQDKLVASFKGVYEDICASPAVGVVSKTKDGR